MKVASSKDRAAGFAIVETLLILIIIAAIVGIGAYVLHQNKKASSTLSSTNNTTSNSAPAGTSAAIDQATQQDENAEKSADNTADKAAAADATSANPAVSNVGGAYNESNL